MASNDSIKKTLLVAVLLCAVCSVIVSTAAVMLKPAQVANKALDFNRNILLAAGLLEEGVSVEEQFKQVTAKLVDMETGRFVTVEEAGVTALDSYDMRKASKDAALAIELDGADDIAKIKRQAKVAKVYLIEKNGKVEKVILPVHGYGLWSTMYGFLALESDLNTVVGLGFYEHGETPGLGGEIDNPKWKAVWPGKKVYGSDGGVALSVVKGAATPGSTHDVDGLSGATLTSRGVHNLIQFWLGENGYAPFLAKLKRGEA